jgi:hypothetical protein
MLFNITIFWWLFPEGTLFTEKVGYGTAYFFGELNERKVG